MASRSASGSSTTRIGKDYVLAVVLGTDAGRAPSGDRRAMTIVWLIIWVIANNVGGVEPLILDPVNAWTATLILAIGLDLSAAHATRGVSR